MASKILTVHKRWHGQFKLRWSPCGFQCRPDERHFFPKTFSRGLTRSFSHFPHPSSPGSEDGAAGGREFAHGSRRSQGCVGSEIKLPALCLLHSDRFCGSLTSSGPQGPRKNLPGRSQLIFDRTLSLFYFLLGRYFCFEEFLYTWYCQGYQPCSKRGIQRDIPWCQTGGTLTTLREGKLLFLFYNNSNNNCSIHRLLFIFKCNASLR